MYFTVAWVQRVLALRARGFFLSLGAAADVPCVSFSGFLSSSCYA